MEFEIAQLRHMYANMVNGGVKDSAAAKRIAEGLLAPVIESLERRHTERLSLCSEQIKVLEDARSIAMEFTSKARIPECGEFGKIAQDLDWLLSQLKNQKEMKKPMFWVRLRSDGGYEGPIHHDAIESVRKSCGDWHPLYLESVPKQEVMKADVNSMIKAPARWLPEEIEDGYRGIRWIACDGVYGVPTVLDYVSYMEMIGRREEIDTWLAQKGKA